MVLSSKNKDDEELMAKFKELDLKMNLFLKFKQRAMQLKKILKDN